MIKVNKSLDQKNSLEIFEQSYSRRNNFTCYPEVSLRKYQVPANTQISQAILMAGGPKVGAKIKFNYYELEEMELLKVSKFPLIMRAFLRKLIPIH